MAIKYIGNSVKLMASQEEVREIFKELKKDVGDVVEPVSLHALEPELLKAIWLILREVIIIDGTLERVQKEAIAAAVSKANRCEYCVDAHTIMLIGLKNNEVSKAIENRAPESILDAYMRSIVQWGLENKNFDSVIIKYPPFTLRTAPEAIGTAIFFHYLNRMAFAFLGPTVLPINVPMIKGAVKKMASMMFTKALNAEKQAKALVPVISPDKNLMQWAKSNEQVYNVFINFYLKINELVQEYIPTSLQEKIKTLISQWDGKDEFINNQSLGEFLNIVEDEKCKPLAKILYLQAFSPHKTNNEDIEFVRKSFKEKQNEGILVSMSWVSFHVALHIGDEVGGKFLD